MPIVPCSHLLHCRFCESQNGQNSRYFVLLTEDDKSAHMDESGGIKCKVFWLKLIVHSRILTFGKFFVIVLKLCIQQVMDIFINNLHKNITRLRLVDFSVVNPKQQCNFL